MPDETEDVTSMHGFFVLPGARFFSCTRFSLRMAWHSCWALCAAHPQPKPLPMGVLNGIAWFVVRVAYTALGEAQLLFKTLRGYRRTPSNSGVLICDI